ncbi:IS110 family transposase [Streptomyces sp. NBC_01240]|uniref:IS110 family transposase n=1 Tax=Streptomyces sp. NBC_01240 TaxID=2903793 RepID=UPI002E13FAB9|nr:IS110 family transposase [Streptomyces sp. NBC_01240]
MVGGIDTHADLHQAAVIDSIGRHLATEQFETTPEGYRRLLNWLQPHGENLAVGIEGTGAYGSEIARFLAANGVTMVEVDRPDRKARRDNAKSAPPSTPTPRRPLSCPAGTPGRQDAGTPGRRDAGTPGRGTGSWRQSGPCGWSARARSRPASGRSTRSPHRHRSLRGQGQAARTVHARAGRHPAAGSPSMWCEASRTTPEQAFRSSPDRATNRGGSLSLRWAVSHTELRAHGRHESVGVVLCQISTFSTFRRRHAHCAERRPGRQAVRGVHGPRRRGR